MIPLNVAVFAGTVLVPLAEEIPDPDDVKPGWLGLLVVVLLAAAVVFLLFSFRKQLKKVDFEEPSGKKRDGEPPDGNGGTRPTAPPPS